MPDSTTDDLKTLRAEVTNLRADLAKISDALKSLVKHGGQEAVDKAMGAAETLQDEISKKTRRLSQEIEQKPLTAMLAAFGLGVILGRLVFRRH